MTKHRMVTMRLHRNGVILAIVLSLLLAVLIFASGYLAGVRRAARAATVQPEAVSTSARAPQPQPAAAEATPSAPALTIRAGVFPDEDDAKALADRLAAQKIAASVVPSQTDGGQTLYLVVTGRYATRADAAVEVSRLEREQGLATAVIPAIP